MVRGFAITIQALAALLGAGICGGALGLILARILGASDPTGWSALGGLVFGLLLGVPLGAILGTLIAGRVFHLGGSVLWTLSGGVVGIFLLLASARAASVLVTAACALLAVALPVFGYHVRALRRKTKH